MRLPFVSRSSHEETCAVFKRWADAEKENAAMLRRSLVDMTARYHQLKLAGAVESTPVQPREPKEPDPIAKAINQAAGSDRTLRALMYNQVQRDKAADPLLTDAELALRITAGMAVTDGGLPQ